METSDVEVTLTIETVACLICLNSSRPCVPGACCQLPLLWRTLPCIPKPAASSNMSASKKVINFGAGPAKLPEEVLVEVQKELRDYENTGMSIMELSHRGESYTKLNQNAMNSLRELLQVPANYKILFLQGGATACFSSIPLNLTKEGATADYFVTGIWSEKAAKEATKYVKVNRVFPKVDHYELPDKSSWNLSSDASYVYYCDNETVHGIEFPEIPETKGIPIVCDMSSNILTRRFDVSKFAVIFAGAQKNIGPAGITVVIIRSDLLGHARPHCPLVMDYSAFEKENSLMNTPPTFIVYVMSRVFEWVKRHGGIEEMEKLSKQKSKLIYNTIEACKGFYVSAVANPGCRSRVNIPFRVGSASGDTQLESAFLKQVESLRYEQLKGHRTVGGIRASLYNAITISEAQQLANFMLDFYKRNSK